MLVAHSSNLWAPFKYMLEYGTQSPELNPHFGNYSLHGLRPGLWFSTNKEWIPIVVPIKTHYSSLHVLFHSFLPTLNPKPYV